MQKYRTEEQFFEICDSIINGNYQQAIDQAVEYGFSAVDLANYVHSEIVQGNINNGFIIDATDFYYICEGIGRAKGQTDIKLNDAVQTEVMISG